MHARIHLQLRCRIYTGMSLRLHIQPCWKTQALSPSTHRPSFLQCWHHASWTGCQGLHLSCPAQSRQTLGDYHGASGNSTSHQTVLISYRHSFWRGLKDSYTRAPADWYHKGVDLFGNPKEGSRICGNVHMEAAVLRAI